MAPLCIGLYPACVTGSVAHSCLPSLSYSLFTHAIRVAEAKARFTPNVFCTDFLTILKWVYCIPIVLFTHDVIFVKKIKGAADKNGAKNGTCKRSLMQGTTHFLKESNMFVCFLATFLKTRASLQKEPYQSVY